jgi:hypothetical protein
MSAGSIVQHRRRISRGVYGLLSMAATTFVLILVIIQLENSEGGRREALVNNYHLVISKKGLELLSAIDASRLWFRDHDIEREESADANDSESPLLPLRTGLMVNDQIDALKYDIERVVAEISRIQAQFAHPEFKNISSILKKRT